MDPKDKKGAKKRPHRRAPRALDTDNIHVAEKIVAIRVRGGRYECLLKWQGFPNSQNTWEPRRSLLGSEINAEFRRLRKELNVQARPSARRNAGSSLPDVTFPVLIRKKKSGRAGSSTRRAAPAGRASTQKATPAGTKTSTRKPSLGGEATSASTSQQARVSGPKRSRALEVEKILSAQNRLGKTFLRFKWKGKSGTTWIQTREAKRRYPKQVLAFYEGQLAWFTPSSSTDPPRRLKRA